MSRSGGVCVFSERRDVSLELLTIGRTLAGDDVLISIAVGPDGEATAREQIARGASGAFVVEPDEESRRSEVQVEALRQVLAKRGPEIVLVGATAHGTEIASRLAQREEVGCASECTKLAHQDGKLLVERTCLGRFVARQVIETRPAIATVQPRRFEPPERDEDRSGRLWRLNIEARETRTQTVDTRHREKSSVRIDKADVVVGIGRGLRSKDDLKMIEELARALGAVVGASRPLTDDLQWLPPDVKVGLSGVTVKPKLYIACGISPAS
jgi:electron transfer flavoprotein alpha subunit